MTSDFAGALIASLAGAPSAGQIVPGSPMVLGKPAKDSGKPATPEFNGGPPTEPPAAKPQRDANDAGAVAASAAASLVALSLLVQPAAVSPIAVSPIQMVASEAGVLPGPSVEAAAGQAGADPKPSVAAGTTTSAGARFSALPAGPEFANVQPAAQEMAGPPGVGQSAPKAVRGSDGLPAREVNRAAVETNGDGTASPATAGPVFSTSAVTVAAGEPPAKNLGLAVSFAPNSFPGTTTGAESGAQLLVNSALSAAMSSASTSATSAASTAASNSNLAPGVADAPGDSIRAVAVGAQATNVAVPAAPADGHEPASPPAPLVPAGEPRDELQVTARLDAANPPATAPAPVPVPTGTTGAPSEARGPQPEAVKDRALAQTPGLAAAPPPLRQPSAAVSSARATKPVRPASDVGKERISVDPARPDALRTAEPVAEPVRSAGDFSASARLGTEASSSSGRGNEAPLPGVADAAKAAAGSPAGAEAGGNPDPGPSKPEPRDDRARDVRSEQMLSEAAPGKAERPASAASGPEVSAAPQSGSPVADAAQALPTGVRQATAHPEAGARPQVQQMLDAAPVTAATTTGPAGVARLAASPELHAQMHVVLRTEAFGAIEIRTAVEQSEVGVTVHADRELARWFHGEVAGLEAGLNSNHLHLTGVEFDASRSAMQAAGGFSQGQPRQAHPQAPLPVQGGTGNPAARENEDSAPVGGNSPTPVALPAGTRVSIRV